MVFVNLKKNNNFDYFFPKHSPKNFNENGIDFKQIFLTH